MKFDGILSVGLTSNLYHALEVTKTVRDIMLCVKVTVLSEQIIGTLPKAITACSARMMAFFAAMLIMSQEYNKVTMDSSPSEIMATQHNSVVDTASHIFFYQT